MMRAKTTVLCAALALASTPARAVSLWERAMTERPATARDVIVTANTTLQAQVNDHLLGVPHSVERRLLEELGQAYTRALALDPRNTTALSGLARIEETLGRYGQGHYERSRAYAERALELAPTGPDATDVLFSLALACMRLERFEEARDAYLRELEFTLEDDTRAVVYGNLGDTYVLLDELPRAIAAYRAALSAQSSAMGWLSLAVALDRDGSDESARAADDAVLAAVHTSSARRASHGQLTVADDPRDLSREISSPNVFFVPDYDRHYYDALADEAIARALDAADTTAAAETRLAAATAWEFYLRTAPPTDRWRARAERHLRALRAPARSPAPRRGPVVTR